MDKKHRISDPEAEPERERGDKNTPGHPAEVEFARILDFYGIEWEYEPRTFALERNGDGTIKEGFSPDFYLPEFDLYIELTTMRQRLVTAKNRKVRRLRELFPDINIKILYDKDLQNLMVKYGLHRRTLPWKTTSRES